MFHISKQQRVNTAIKSKEVLLVTQDTKPERLSLDAAIERARAQNMDLVEINPNSTPPMCKIMDYGKFMYKKKKQEQEARKKQRVKGNELKTIRFGFNTGEHDLMIREKQAQGFLEKGNMVKIQVIGRGRELAYKDLALEKVKKFVARLEDFATVETLPKISGNMIIAIVKPNR